MSLETKTSKEQQYIEGFQQINQMLRLGKSFSGRERNCFFLNTGKGNFANISSISGFDFPDDCRGLARCDWDFDGKTDLWTTNRNGPNVRFLRNNIATKNNFVSFWLEGNGKNTNRNSIGAKIEVVLNDKKHKRIKTSRAGDSFQSQSSRWINFGLGNFDSIEKVIVNWPDGTVSEHKAKVDSWYVIQQGRTEAQKWSPPNIQLENDLTIEPDTPTSASRTVLATPVPFPNVSFKTFEDTERTLIEESNPQASLVVLWATWCPHCLTEMGELQAHRADIDNAGVEVIALCVDALGDERGATADKARELLAQNKMTFASGPATPELMALLQTVDEYIFDRPRSLPVPASFLFDQTGNLIAVYKGPVSTKQLLQDSTLIAATPDERIKAAIPFEGIWSNPQPTQNNLLILVNMLAQQNRLGDVEFYLRRLLESDPADFAACTEYCQLLVAQQRVPEAVKLCTAAVNANPDDIDCRLLQADMFLHNRQPDLAETALKFVLEKQPNHPACLLNLGFSYLDRQVIDEATKYFQMAITADESFIEAHIQLAKSLAIAGKFAEALEGIEKAIELDPSRPDVFLAKAEIHLQNRQPTKAIAEFEIALKLDDEIVAAHFQLGRCLEQTGNRSEAVIHFEAAAKLAPNNPLIINQWGIVKAQNGELDEAIECFEACLKIDPSYKAASDNLARARKFKDSQKKQID